jgi:hypothetical protein
MLSRHSQIEATHRKPVGNDTLREMLCFLLLGIRCKPGWRSTIEITRWTKIIRDNELRPMKNVAVDYILYAAASFVVSVHVTMPLGSGKFSSSRPCDQLIYRGRVIDQSSFHRWPGRTLNVFQCSVPCSRHACCCFIASHRMLFVLVTARSRQRGRCFPCTDKSIAYLGLRGRNHRQRQTVVLLEHANAHGECDRRVESALLDIETRLLAIRFPRQSDVVPKRPLPPGIVGHAFRCNGVKV